MSDVGSLVSSSKPDEVCKKKKKTFYTLIILLLRIWIHGKKTICEKHSVKVSATECMN